MELSGLNVDYASLSVEIQEKMAAESDLLSVGFPDQTIVLLANTLAGGLAMLNYSQLTVNLNNFIPFAFLKSAGYAISATLGVAPRRKTSSSMVASIRSSGDAATFINQLDASVTIPPYTRFRCRNRVWHTRESYLIHPADASIDVQLFEGSVFIEKFTGLGEKYQRWYVGSAFNVDNNTVRVKIDNDFWTEAFEGSFVYYRPGEQVFIQQTSPDGKVLVFFGNGLYGKIPPAGSDISVYYTVNSGFDANSASVGDDVTLLDQVLIGPGAVLLVDGISITPSTGGEDEETLDDIKYISPRLYAAANRAVRRDDYIGHLLGAKAPIVFADAFTWGEYEQAKKEGIGQLWMMNRAYWTGILRTFDKIEEVDVIVATGGQEVFDFALGGVSIYPGSLHVTNSDNDILLNDDNGNGVLVSPDLVFNCLTGGSIAANSTAGGSFVSSVIDSDLETFWESLIAPDTSAPIRIMYDWGVGVTKIAKSVRIRAANFPGREQRAFPNLVSVWGTNVVNPLINTDIQWEPIRGRVELNDPGILGYCPWITLLNSIPYRYIMIKIEGRWGSQGNTKISEWQVQEAADSSTIDYGTLAVHVKYPTGGLLGDSTLQDSYYGPDLTKEQQGEVFEYLKKYNHYTTDITYRSPIMQRVEVEVEVYYISDYDENTVFSQVEAALTNLFAIRKGTIGRMVSQSDLVSTVLEIEGVDYCVFLNPSLGGDLFCDLGEFIYLANVRVNMYVTDRDKRFRSTA